MDKCAKCKFKKECRSLSDWELTCEEVERIAKDYQQRESEKTDVAKGSYIGNNRSHVFDP